MTTRHVAVPGAMLDVDERGLGEPVVFVQTALIADELRPVADHPALAERHRRIVYHRRGYAGSTPIAGPGSVARDASDCAAVLDALGVSRAHMVGVSYSAAICLTLAVAEPARVHSVALLEPPPVHTPSAGEFRAANDHLVQVRQEHGASAALDEFLSNVVGPSWRDVVEEWLPGVTSQMLRDAETFFDTDLPALLAWQFGPDAARQVRCPVLHVGGTDSGPWFAQVRQQILDWFPDAGDVVIDGAGHSLALTHPAQVAETLARFFDDHPMGSA